MCVRVQASVAGGVHDGVCPCWYANHPIPLCQLLKITPTRAAAETKLQTDGQTPQHSETEEGRTEAERKRQGLPGNEMREKSESPNTSPRRILTGLISCANRAKYQDKQSLTTAS